MTAALTVARGRRVDDVMAWLRDKPLPEDSRWSDGATLGDVVGCHTDTDAEGVRVWVLRPRVDVRDAFRVLTDEVDDAVAIHRDIASTVSHDDDSSVRPSLRVLQRLRRRLDAV